MPAHFSFHFTALGIAVAMVATGCSRTGFDDGEPDAEIDEVDASGDTMVDPTPNADSNTMVDVGADIGPRPAPPIDTPNRSDALNQLYCELDNGHLVQAALRAHACLGVSIAGVMEDAARGFVGGEMLQSTYGRATLGNCDFLACLNNAENCAQARDCEDQRVLGQCDINDRYMRCDGTWLDVCNWDGEDYHWTRIQDCSRLNAVCEECEGDRCFPQADCVFEESGEACEGYYGWCDGDVLRRCQDFETSSGAIPCDQLVEDGVCGEAPVGGEAPGPICRVANFRMCERVWRGDGMHLGYRDEHLPLRGTH